MRLYANLRVGNHTKGAKRKRRSVVSREFLPKQFVSDLWAIAVHDADVPSVSYELDNRPQAFARVPELILYCRVLAGRRERVASQRDDRGGCGIAVG